MLSFAISLDFFFLAEIMFWVSNSLNSDFSQKSYSSPRVQCSVLFSVPQEGVQKEIIVLKEIMVLQGDFKPENGNIYEKYVVKLIKTLPSHYFSPWFHFIFPAYSNEIKIEIWP